ncbi:MAG TPA: dihydropteroate synthase [Ignavibacteriaceae bacterium]|nr:dihydropteroate synthase [Ignavibacterium sp.]HMN24453.1 dihydropteroate synthase [Ignavibacteriaceae bacterium]HRN25788.1 dihydropteroate synthase [Ignavibacteriaceae bacterium]HRP92917.1 dihydropteroate synthase [Ignavibacteriaceae bacterium]HRQ53477.1 dihydropteroate synthase [Ignavibacteriaceae bacterium]
MKNHQYNFKNSRMDFRISKIMGIVNVTPDSFSDGGKYFSLDNAVDRALKLIDDGADIIDIGGESTRPGSDPVSADEEINRTIPVIKKITNLRKDVIISIDTTKSNVAKQALDSGAQIINDISGLTFDNNMINTAKEFDAAVVIMHIKGNPKTMQDNPHYNDVVKEVFNFLLVQSKKAKQNGIEKIIVDPGIGFGKNIDDNFILIKNLDYFQSLSYPVMIGVSKKSFIGKTLSLDSDEREIGTVVLETISILKSARIIRTHNVKYCSQIVKLAAHIL